MKVKLVNQKTMSQGTMYLSRTGKSLFIVLFHIFLMALIAGIFFSCQKKEEIKILKIGLPEEPKSLNLWLGTDTNSRKILSQIYQPLYIRDPKTLKIIPWLAKDDPLFDEQKLTYTVKLREAKWADGSEFTSEDVLFTKKIFFDFKIPRYYSKWKAIKQLEAIDKHTIVFHLKQPSAIFSSRILTAPMVSKKEWEKITVKAMKAEKKQKKNGECWLDLEEVRPNWHLPNLATVSMPLN